MLLMWTVNVWKWSFEPRPSVQLFLGGDTFSKEPVCFHVNIRTRSFVRLSICTMAHSQSDVGRGGGTIKTNGPDILFCPWSDLVFIFFIFIFLSWMNAQSSACSSLLWSAEKLQWILFGSVWDFVLEVHLYMWLMSFFICFIWPGFTLSLHHSSDLLIFFISKYFDNLLNRWGKCFASLKKEV